MEDAQVKQGNAGRTTILGLDIFRNLATVAAARGPEVLPMNESRKRSVMKALSWRITATLATMIIVFLFTGNLAVSIVVGVIEGVAKVLWYYVHERLWEHIPWGRAIHPLASLPVSKELAPQDLQIIHERLQDLGYL